MPDGFFLGGVARQRLAQGEIDLQNRRLEQDERAAAQEQQNKILNDLRSQRQDLFTQLDKVVQASIESGLTQEQFLSGVRPIAEQIVAHADGARRAGFDFSPQGDAELARSKIGLFQSPEQLAQQERDQVIRSAQNEADARLSTAEATGAAEAIKQNAINRLSEPGQLIPVEELLENVPPQLAGATFIRQPNGNLKIVSQAGGELEFFRQELADGSLGVFVQDPVTGESRQVSTVQGENGPIKTGVSARSERSSNLRERELLTSQDRLAEKIIQNTRGEQGRLRDDFRVRAKPFRDLRRDLDKLDTLLSGDITALDNKAITNLVARSIAPSGTRAQSEIGDFGNPGDIIERLSGSINKFFAGARTQEQLNDIRKLSNELRFKFLDPGFDVLKDSFVSVAEISKVDPKSVITELNETKNDFQEITLDNGKKVKARFIK